jgi:hypothetical protein
VVGAGVELLTGEKLNSDTKTFCTMIRNRSEENRRAMNCFSTTHSVLSPAFSILRQELDSMIRVIYLLEIPDLEERQRLIRSTLAGKRWEVSTHKGKARKVTDKEMVDLAQQLQGWTQSVYKFGCAFVHLSDFHNHQAQNPFQKLTKTEQQNVLTHMRNYHGGPMSNSPSMDEFSKYLPQIFDKIAGNLGCYLQHLENNEIMYQ